MKTIDIKSARAPSCSTLRNWTELQRQRCAAASKEAAHCLLRRSYRYRLPGRHRKE